MFLRLLTLTLLAQAICSFASINDAARIYQKNRRDYRNLTISLVEGGYYFSALPFMKEYLVSNKGRVDESLERAFDKLLSYTGSKPFEVLPSQTLNRINSSNVKYILAKKYFREGKYQTAQKMISSINASHPVYPFALHLQATIYSILNQNDLANSSFKDCVDFSGSRLKRTEDPFRVKQLNINKDTCILGVARSQFASGNYQQADLSYLDVPKSSPVWPQVLFEEAWNSYYLNNYNRTLGKLVSYRAPVLDFIFNPEIEVLKALSYYRLCLYDDAKESVDNFYGEYLSPAKKLRKFIRSKGKNYDYFYKLAVNYEAQRVSEDGLLTKALQSVVRDLAYQELKESVVKSFLELEKVKNLNNSSFKRRMEGNLQSVINTYQKIIGSFVRGNLINKYNEVFTAFKSMSYIKLEVLSERKKRLYQNRDFDSSKRGDVKYIKRNEKQYFWDFNGEFWADELGDYVFALGSKC